VIQINAYSKDRVGTLRTYSPPFIEVGSSDRRPDRRPRWIRNYPYLEYTTLLRHSVVAKARYVPSLLHCIQAYNPLTDNRIPFQQIKVCNENHRLMRE